MASYKSCIFTLFFVGILLKRIRSKEYILSKLNQCTRVPDEPPCNISFNHFVPDYASQRYEIMMETIYRKSKDIMRLDSRPQCVNTYKDYLCAQLFPRCSKHQNPRFENLEMQRWVVHDPDIKMKCWKIFAACNSRVANRFMSSDYFLCDHLTYTPLGWESDRCVPYDLDTRCDKQQYGKLPMWFLNYHDQNLIQYLNVTIHRLNHTLPKTCRQRLLNIHCRHPWCSSDGQHIVVNFTRQQCDKYLECARFVPGEVNVNAICIMFPSSTVTLMSSLALVVTAVIIHGFIIV